MTPSTSWGAIWSAAGGAAVLRPTSLPEDAARETFWGAVTATYGLTAYHVSYRGRDDDSPLGFFAGREWISGRWFTFIAQTELKPTPRWWFVNGLIPRGPGQSSGAIEIVTARDHCAELITRDHPYVNQWTLQLSWSESGYRYAVQASFRSSRDELLRIADSLRLVSDESGNTAPERRVDHAT